MKINIEFLNGSNYWRGLVATNAETVQRILSDPRFLDLIRAHPAFDFTSDTPAQVADKIANANEVTIQVRFNWNPFGRAIASESGGGVRFNTAKRGAGSVENIAHEIQHALGYSHNGNSPAGQGNTEPWAVGQLVGYWAAYPPAMDVTPVAKSEVVS